MALRLPGEAEVQDLLSGMELPRELLLGTASAGYQCEGGYNAPGAPRNNWAEWESRPGNERTGPGARFWENPERDLELAQAMGLNAHRLSIEWARVQPVFERQVLPQPPPWDDRALDRYVDILIASRERGLEPVVTLHHFTHPYWTGLDLWQSDAGVERFASYVAQLMPQVNERLLERGSPAIKWWITINEPNGLAPGSYLARWMPSGAPLDLRSPARFFTALDCLYAAHVRAYEAIHRWYEANGQPRPKVTINNFALDFYWNDRVFIDLLLSRSRGVAWGPALRADIHDRAQKYGQAVAGLIGHSRAIAPERWLAAGGVRTLGRRVFARDRFRRLRAALEACDYARPLDVIAVDYYDPTLANQLQLAAGAYEPWDWEAHPEGLYEVLLANAEDGLDVMVAENGMSVRRLPGTRGEPRADGVTRDAFIRAHLFHLLRAMKAGVRVCGYLHWSLTDNYEWGRFAPRFGIHAVDYSDPRRRRLPVDGAGVDAATTYGAIARALRARDKEALARALVG